MLSIKEIVEIAEMPSSEVDFGLQFGQVMDSINGMDLDSLNELDNSIILVKGEDDCETMRNLKLSILTAIADQKAKLIIKRATESQLNNNEIETMVKESFSRVWTLSILRSAINNSLEEAESDSTMDDEVLDRIKIGAAFIFTSMAGILIEECSQS